MSRPVAPIVRTTESRFTLTAFGSGATEAADGVLAFVFGAAVLSATRERGASAEAAEFRTAAAFNDSSTTTAGRLMTGRGDATTAGASRSTVSPAASRSEEHTSELQSWL